MVVRLSRMIFRKIMDSGEEISDNLVVIAKERSDCGNLLADEETSTSGHTTYLQ